MKTLSYSGVLFDDRRRFYPNPQMVAMLFSSVTPFISTLFAKPSQTTPDKDYKLFEHRAAWRYQRLDVQDDAGTGITWSPDGAPGSTITTEVLNPVGVEINDSLLGSEFDIWDSTSTTRKGVAIVVGVDAGASTLTLRALGNPSSATETIPALADGDILFDVGTAFGEGSDAPEASEDELDVVWGSVQRHKTSVEVTEDVRRAVLRGKADELARLRNEKQKEHKIKMERTALFGYRPGGIGGVAHGAGGGTDSTFVKHITDSQGRTVSASMGAFSALERYGESSDTSDAQNVFAPDADTYAYADFVDDVDKVFQYGGEGVKTAWCGGKVLSFFSTKVATNSQWEVQISGTQTSRLGFNYRLLETPHGMLRLVRLPILRRTPYESAMFIPSEEDIKRVTYAPFEYQTNIKTDNAPDLVKDVFQSWEGLGLTLIEKHSLWKFANL